MEAFLTEEADSKLYSKSIHRIKSRQTPWLSWECWRHVDDTSANMHVGANTKITSTQEFCVGDHRQIVETIVHTDTVVHTPRGGNTVDKLNKSKSSRHVCKRFEVGAAIGMLVVLLLLPLSLAVDNSEFDHGGGSGGGGGPAAAAAAAEAGKTGDDNWRQKRPTTRALTVT
jgi:hypothetical protein